MHKATTPPNVWYFAYGSNMSASKFTGSRGIQPLATARARLPGWTLTTEIPGTPYSEPAYTSIRPISGTDDKAREVLGRAYLITAAQYVHLVASEGGGIAYADIAISSAVPATQEDEQTVGKHVFGVRTLGTIMRRDPTAVPSQRYMVSFSLFSPLPTSPRCVPFFPFLSGLTHGTSIGSAHAGRGRGRLARGVLPLLGESARVRASQDGDAQDRRAAVPCVLEPRHVSRGEDGAGQSGAGWKCAGRRRASCSLCCLSHVGVSRLCARSDLGTRGRDGRTSSTWCIV